MVGRVAFKIKKSGGIVNALREAAVVLKRDANVGSRELSAHQGVGKPLRTYPAIESQRGQAGNRDGHQAQRIAGPAFRLVIAMVGGQGIFQRSRPVTAAR